VPQGGGGDIGGQIVGHAILNLLMNPMTPYGKAAGRNIAMKLTAGALDNAARTDLPGCAFPPADLPGKASATGEEAGGTK
jgi:hypothetical protein